MSVIVRGFFKGLRQVLAPFMLLNERLSRPQPIERSREKQAEVDRECQSLKLYQFRTCPFCIRVRKQMHRLALPIELRDTQHDERNRQALKEGGGRVKVPCLQISRGEGNVEWMYESDAINRYLSEHFEPAAA